jgi:phosphoribosyl 1,2-cyclic phosphate phosphodiesterase
MTLSLTILGCGSSAGVPRPALGWGACDPTNPKNRRRRCSLLVEQTSDHGTTRIVIDTSPDLREQLIDANVDHIDAVFLTHEHADQTHGIDDLRSVVLHQRKRIPVYLNRATADHILLRFSYCFVSPPGSDYPPILDHHAIEAGESRTIEGKGGPVTLSAFILQHGNIPALGYRIADAAYTPDVSDIPAASWPFLENLELWIIDGLRYTQHPSHFSVNDALAWIDRFKPRRAVITNMHSDLDYEVLRQRLPPNVIPAYDGMRLTLEQAPYIRPCAIPAKPDGTDLPA